MVSCLCTNALSPNDLPIYFGSIFERVKFSINFVSPFWEIKRRNKSLAIRKPARGKRSPGVHWLRRDNLSSFEIFSKVLSFFIFWWGDTISYSCFLRLFTPTFWLNSLMVRLKALIWIIYYTRTRTHIAAIVHHLLRTIYLCASTTSIFSQNSENLFVYTNTISPLITECVVDCIAHFNRLTLSNLNA